MTRKYTLGATLTAAAIAGLVLVPGASFARGGGGMGGGMGGMSGMHGNFGGNSSTHISPTGLSNTNGANATTRTFGTDRAMTVTGSHIPINVGSANVSAGASTTTPNGGQSSAHISASGLANGNGANATTRVFGKARAAARHALHPTTDADGDRDKHTDTDNDGD